MNKLILTGVVAGIAASIPALYQSNPQAFEAMLRFGLSGQETGPTQQALPAAPPRLAAARTEEPVLLGRKVRLPPLSTPSRSARSISTRCRPW